jgi:hypothetical protein
MEAEAVKPGRRKSQAGAGGGWERGRGCKRTEEEQEKRATAELTTS